MPPFISWLKLRNHNMEEIVLAENTKSKNTHNTKRASNTKKGTTSSKPKNASRQSKPKAVSKKEEAEKRLRKKRRTSAIFLFAGSILLFFLFFFPSESIWLGMHRLMWGLFGYGGLLVPCIVMFAAYQLSKEKLVYRFSFRIILFILIVLFLSSAIYLYGFYPSTAELYSYWSELGRCYTLGVNYQGAGLFGGILGALLAFMFGMIGSRITIILLLFVVIMLATGSSLLKFFETVKKPVYKVSEKVAEQKVRHNEERAVRTQQKKQHQMYIFSDESTNEKAESRPISDENTVDVRNIPIYEPPQVSHSVHPKAKKHQKKPAPITQENHEDYFEMQSVQSTEQQFIQQNISDYPQTQDDDFFSELTEQSSDYSQDFDDEVQDDEVLNMLLPEDIEPQLDNISVQNDIIDSSNISHVLSASQKQQESHQEAYTKKTSVNEPVELEEKYLMPPVCLLEAPPEEDNENISLELKQNGTILVDTLKSFGVSTGIVNISRGPSVTRYELQPAPGVKISKITNLADDIAMNLAAVGVRIEAPIPGKSAVGIEVPNKNTTIVKMRNIIESPEFVNAKSKLTVALGYDIAGKIVLADLSKMPHLLIAGSTGSGKSVCINSMLISLLYKANPDEVKLMLIDPKVVELGVYNGIPHLLVPVVTDPRKASGALSWAVNEMLKRYNTFAECNVRDIKGYNRLVEKQNSEADEWEETHSDDITQRSFEEDEMLAQAQAEVSEKTETPPERLTKMPQVVIVIDELADLMMAAPNEVEESICRLAQMARAAGMHLVIATQRPSVDVITGLIKANVPSRIAFAVKSQIDSRTILDGGGAEKLLGRGDMLYSPIGTNKPMRVQGCFVDDSEIEQVIEFVKKSHISEYDDNIMEEIEKNAVAEASKSSQDNDSTMDLDPVMEDAIKCVVEAGQASTSLLQRRLRLGYARAGRLIDEMEQMGIVGPHEGSKPRQVLMSYQQWLERNMSRKDTP